MLILKLNLPEGAVSYNKVGKRVSTPIPNVPEKVKATNLNIQVNGYYSDALFIATGLKCEEKVLTIQEQMTLLRQLGFKTIPIQRVPQNNSSDVNLLIKIKQQYADYSPKWWSIKENKEYILPELRTILSISWGIDSKGRLVKVLDTENGQYQVVDHNAPEYYQPGSIIKVQDNKVFPFKSTPITVHTPCYCPVCNNPLSKMQISMDTPLILKCKSPICPKLRVTDDELPKVEKEVSPEDFSFRDETADTPAELEILEEAEPELVNQETPTTQETEGRIYRILSLDVEPDSLKSVPGIEIITDEHSDSANACDFILIKSKRAVSKRTRKAMSRMNLQTLTLDELTGLLKEREAPNGN